MVTELELSKRIKEGNREAFGALYRLYAPYLYNLIMRYVPDRETAKDVLHDAFIHSYEQIGKYEYRGEGSLKSWLSRLFVNEALMHLRQAKRISFVPLNEEVCSEGPAWDEIDEEEVARIPIEDLQTMIAALPEGYRMVFNLFVVEGMSHKQIASLLGINEKSSSGQLARAKQRLATEIKKWYTTHEI